MTVLHRIALAGGLHQLCIVRHIGLGTTAVELGRVKAEFMKPLDIPLVVDKTLLALTTSTAVQVPNSRAGE